MSVPLQKTPSLQGVFAAIFVHVPGEVPLHVWQSFGPPAHALVQQTLSTHVSALHMAVRKHGAPTPSFVLHWPLVSSQYCVALHWLSAEHEPRHTVPLQG